MTEFKAPTPEHVCDKCYRPSSPANLIELPNGQRWCPYCVGERIGAQLRGERVDPLQTSALTVDGVGEASA